MKYDVLKKLFYGTAVAFIATASVPSLLPVCITGSKAQMDGLRPAQAKNPRAVSFDEPHSYLPRVAAKPTTTMVPSNRGTLPREAQSALIPRPESLDRQAEAPRAIKASPTPSFSQMPELPFQQKLQKKAPAQQNSVLKSLLSPFAYASAKLRALDPWTYIDGFIMKCVRGVTGFFGKQMLGKSIDADMTPMIMRVIHMGVGMAVRPVISYFITPRTQDITSFFIKGSVDVAGRATGVETIQRGSRFIGTFLTEYFMNKASFSFNKNMYLLQTTYKSLQPRDKKTLLEGIKLPLDTEEEYLRDTATSRIIILGGNVVHLLGDLHNLLFTQQTAGSDTIDKYLKMSQSVINLADYALFTYKNTTLSAVDLKPEMKAYLTITIQLVEVIKAVHQQLTSFKQQADANGMTPMLNMMFEVAPDVEAQLAGLQPGAGMLTGQMDGLAQMFAMAGQQ